jgi:hypothetical protein
MALFPGTPKLESRNCSEIVLGGVSGLWALITPDCEVWLRRGLNQTCSPRRDVSNDVLHSQFEGRKEVDSRLLVVGSQTASLTPGPSFAHNLGCRCPNGQCEAIFDIYVPRPFQWHQEHLNARFFGPWYRTLNIWESRRIPNPQLWKCWASPPHLAKVGLRHLVHTQTLHQWQLKFAHPPLIKGVGTKDTYAWYYGTFRNPSLGLTTKARGCKVVGQEKDSKVTSHVLGSAKECEGMNLHIPKWTPMLGARIPMESKIFIAQLQKSKPISSKKSLYYWKDIET